MRRSGRNGSFSPTVEEEGATWPSDREDVSKLAQRVSELEAKSSHPPGCICPPTSEKTCGNQLCPRKGNGVLHQASHS